MAFNKSFQIFKKLSCYYLSISSLVFHSLIPISIYYIVTTYDISQQSFINTASHYLAYYYPSIKKHLPTENVIDNQNSSSEKYKLPTSSITINNQNPIHVCEEGCQFSTVSSAIHAAKPNSVIYVHKKNIKTCLVINKSISIVGERTTSAERPLIDNIACQGKGPIIIDAPNVLISNLEIANIQVSDRNGSCVRIHQNAHDTTLDQIYCHDSESGILSNIDSGTLHIKNSLFARNGLKGNKNKGKGQSHGMYLISRGRIKIENTQILSTKEGGQTLKITAPEMIIEKSVLASLNGKSSRAIDNFGGGKLTIKNSIIQQGPNIQTRSMFGILTEPERKLAANSEILLENNWLIFDKHKENNSILNLFFKNQLFFTHANIESITLLNNWIVDMDNIGIDNIDVSNNNIFSARSEIPIPEFDGTLNTLPTGD